MKGSNESGTVEKINDQNLEKIESLKIEIEKMEQITQFASGGDRDRQEKYINEAKAELAEYQRKQSEVVSQAPAINKNEEIRNNYNARLEEYRKKNAEKVETPVLAQEKSQIEQSADEAEFGGYAPEGFENLVNQANEAKVAQEENNTNA